MISKHISLKEATRSQTATKHGIDNSPTELHLLNMVTLANKVFEPLRDHFGVKLYISSFYRSEALNSRIGGSSSSQHCKGQAMDIDADVYGGVIGQDRHGKDITLTNAMVFDYIAKNLEFDQLIWEFGDDSNPNWVHVSYNQNENRGNVLVAKKVGGKTKYITFDGSL